MFVSKKKLNKLEAAFNRLQQQHEELYWYARHKELAEKLIQEYQDLGGLLNVWVTIEGIYVTNYSYNSAIKNLDYFRENYINPLYKEKYEECVEKCKGDKRASKKTKTRS